MLKALKENLTLLSLMVVLVGTSSTDAYYSSFGLRYEFLDISAAHILFRGLTAVWAFPALLLAYLIALALVAAQSRLAMFFGGLDKVRWMNHAAVAVLVVTAWFGGRYAGDLAATADMTASTSSLPLISKIDTKEQSLAPVPTTPSEGYRLLMQNSHGIYLFKAVTNARAETPLVRQISSEVINAITICARC